MANLDFPASPTSGQEYTHPTTGTIYVWNGSQWILKFSATGGLNVPDASTTVKGKIQIATNAEVNTGTNTTKAVTPAQLASALASVTGISDASETVKGIVELATVSEATTGTDTVRAVTPAGLAARTPPASDTVKGLVELATNGESVTGTDTTRAVTPAGLAARTPNASTSARGLIQLATGGEVIAGTDAVKAISPATLQALTALNTREGIIRIATATEASEGTLNSVAVTPAQLMSKGVPVGSILLWPLNQLPAGYTTCSGGEVSRATYPDLFAALVTNSTYPAISVSGVSWSNSTDRFTKVGGHGFQVDDDGIVAQFDAGSSIPAGLARDSGSVGVKYYFKFIDANTFELYEDRYLTNKAILTDTGTGANVIFSHYGLGKSDDTTFNVPHITDFVRQNQSGRAIGTHELDDIKSHTHRMHRFLDYGGGSGFAAVSDGGAQDPGNPNDDNVNTGASGGSETRPKNVTMRYIIKLK